VAYFRHDLAFIHDQGYGKHGDRCAPGLLDLLSPRTSSCAMPSRSLPPGLVAVTGRKKDASPG
jgi:hypothetical protein